MFRKRDTDPIDGGDGKDGNGDAEPRPEVELRPEAGKPEAAKKPDVAFSSEPSSNDQPTENQPSEDDRSEAPPSGDHPSGDHPSSAAPSSFSDLPESEPLSTAPKAAAANVSPAASSDAPANKRLIVGQGIRLSGEINSCDRLVVEGEVEVTLNDTLALEITSSGRFTGGCEVEEADISGIYEGDLTVRRRLYVRGTGKLTGTVRYGELELERGGQIAGNISVLSMDGTGGAASERSRAPLFGQDRQAAAAEAKD